MVANNNYEISSEKDAFDYINKALHENLPDHVKLVFTNWPKIDIVLEGEGYDGTITPAMMKALIEVQEGLNRTFAKLVYGQDTARHLKDSDKIELELKAKVENGCSHITVPLEKFFEKLAEELAKKMNPATVIATVAIVAVTWGGVTVAKSHFETEASTKTIQVQTQKEIALSDNETKRMEIFAKATTKYPELESVTQDARNARIEMLKGVSAADSIEINGIKFVKEDADKIATKARSTSTEGQLNGNYKILAVDTSHPEEIRIKIEAENGKSFQAKFQDQSLDQNQIKLLQDAEWSRKKSLPKCECHRVKGRNNYGHNCGGY